MSADDKRSSSKPSQTSARVYYKLKDLSEILGVEKHVLRYWEREFSQIEPIKIGQRRLLYTNTHLAVFREIKRLLYEERYTVAGARKRMSHPPSLLPDATFGLTQVDPAGLLDSLSNPGSAETPEPQKPAVPLNQMELASCAQPSDSPEEGKPAITDKQLTISALLLGLSDPLPDSRGLFGLTSDTAKRLLDAGRSPAGTSDQIPADSTVEDPVYIQTGKLDGGLAEAADDDGLGSAELSAAARGVQENGTKVIKDAGGQNEEEKDEDEAEEDDDFLNGDLAGVPDGQPGPEYTSEIFDALFPGMSAFSPADGLISSSSSQALPKALFPSAALNQTPLSQGDHRFGQTARDFRAIDDIKRELRDIIEILSRPM